MSDVGRMRYLAPVTPVHAPATARRSGTRPELLRLQRTAGNGAVVQLLSARREIASSVPYAQAVQRAILPQDLTAEMAGAHFTLTEDVTASGVALKSGETIEITAWDNTIETASARQLPPAKPSVQFQVPKKLLRPAASGVAGLTPYGAGLGGVVTDYVKGEQGIATENALKGGARPDEVKRLAGLQKNRLRRLNEKLIQGSFLNRFDADIKTWVDFYNVKFGFTGSDALDPNLVKSMLYRETQMGTSGEHLEDLTETGPKIKTRQNILQNIDSGAEALLELIPEEDPALATKHHLDLVKKDLAKVKKTEDHLWADPRFVDAVNEFFASVPKGSPPRNMDYSFWIKSGIRWLIHKRKSPGIKSWAEAARAYNGSGAAARAYKKEVVERAEAAKKAEQAGTEYVPVRL
jgi:hypothetical protein